MHAIATDKAPKAVGPYAQAQRSGNFLFCSGQLGLVPETMTMAGDDVSSQTRQIFKNIRAVLSAAGLNLSNVIKTTVFLKNMGDFQTVNVIYAEEFGDHTPARSAFAVAALPLNGLIEIECIAVEE